VTAGWLRWYVHAAGLARASAAALAAADLRWQEEDARPTVALLLSATLSTGLDRRVKTYRWFPSVWCLPAAVLLPPGWALIVSVPLAALGCWRADRNLAYSRVIAIAAAGLGCGAASLAFHASDTLVPVEPEWLAVVAGCGVLQQVTSNALVAITLRGSGLRSYLPASPCSIDLPSALAELCTGVLVAFAAEANPWYAVFAVPLVIPLQRSWQHRELARTARTDAKTGLLNATAWQQAANVEATRAARTGKPVAVARLDIDHFKKVNDACGHLTGDRVLAAIAAVLTAQLRGYDVAGRFGGEEFAVLLPDTTEADAYRIAERLRAQIAATPVIDGAKSGRSAGRVTVSIGVVGARSGCGTAEELVAAADRALYAAKRAGRNRVRGAASLPAFTIPSKPRRGATADEGNSTEMREWAREKGIEVKGRGRVAKDIVARYKAATGK
jgi:diguanylate cyclase (GGDEF)-like protein